MSNALREIIFNDFYRTLALNVISILFIYIWENNKSGNDWIIYSAFLFFSVGPFSLIFLVGMVFTDFDVAVIRELSVWSIKWIIYFLLMFVLQHVIVAHAKKMNKAVKLFLCMLLFVVSLNISLKVMLPYNIL